VVTKWLRIPDFVIVTAETDHSCLIRDTNGPYLGVRTLFLCSPDSDTIKEAHNPDFVCRALDPIPSQASDPAGAPDRILCERVSSAHGTTEQLRSGAGTCAFDPIAGGRSALQRVVTDS
jgi:hypothetical protein